MAATAVLTVFTAVTRITSSRSSNTRILSSTWSPSIPGSRMSRRTRSTGQVRRISSAWAPSGTSRTSYSSSRIRRNESRTPGSSSTTRMAERGPGPPSGWSLASGRSRPSRGSRGESAGRLPPGGDAARRLADVDVGAGGLPRHGAPECDEGDADAPQVLQETPPPRAVGGGRPPAGPAVVEADAVVGRGLAEGADGQGPAEAGAEEPLDPRGIREHPAGSAIESAERGRGDVAANRQRR